ncbi:MAG: 6-carboxytetrahydropterin synthase [Bacteroidetes bacterium]|nr:MAG: 6-carboxytetrahydropterin synthase [Bacteroidota bacterium]
MPRAYVSRRVHFNAAHRLHNPEKSDEWNAEKYGKCNSANWHGHNYVLEVIVAGTPNDETGYVIDLGLLKRIVGERILSKCDHANLNLDVDFLTGILTSTENVAIAFWNELKDAIPTGELYSVKLWETERNMVEYRGERSGDDS